MANKDLDYWNSVKNYDLEITSVFLENNILTNHIKKIKNKNLKTIGDFGCGIGNSFKYIKEFKKIYATDFSDNMINQAKKQKPKIKNINYYKSEIKTIKFPSKVDTGLAISSIFPKTYEDFDEILNNILSNIKKNGELLISLPSFEALTFLYQLDVKYKTQLGINPQEIKSYIKNVIETYNYDPTGYVISGTGLVQKYWLKEEILFRLEKYKFETITIEKLELNWKTQLKKPEYNNYPKFWFWLIKIKI